MRRENGASPTTAAPRGTYTVLSASALVTWGLKRLPGPRNRDPW